MAEEKRKLAYVVVVEENKDIPNYDRVKLARCNGWWCIVPKDQLFPDDFGIYFEIDSLVPKEDKRFEFLEKRKFKIKTLKMCGVVSQGLLMPISEFPEVRDITPGRDVTDLLKIKYYDPEDQVRKMTTEQLIEKGVSARNKKILRNKFVKKLMKIGFFKKIILSILVDKKTIKRGLFPTDFKFISKTDENRIENHVHYLEDKTPCIVTEKLDGTSATYILERKHKSFEFYVCSRNIRLNLDDGSIYSRMAIKYDIENKLKEILNNNKELDYVCLQGECVGSVQGNPLKLDHDDLYLFNYIDSQNGRYDSLTGAANAQAMGMNWVPILDTNYVLPDSLEEFKAYADGRSALNPEVKREGLVIRRVSDNLSFKNVSNEFLLSKK